MNFSRLLYNQECHCTALKSIKNVYPCYKMLPLILPLSILVFFQGLDGPTSDTGLPGRQGTKVRTVKNYTAIKDYGSIRLDRSILSLYNEKQLLLFCIVMLDLRLSLNSKQSFKD